MTVIQCDFYEIDTDILEDSTVVRFYFSQKGEIGGYYTFHLPSDYPTLERDAEFAANLTYLDWDLLVTAIEDLFETEAAEYVPDDRPWSDLITYTQYRQN